MTKALIVTSEEAFASMIDSVARIISPNCHWGAGYINGHVDRRRDNARAKAREVMRLTMGIPLGDVVVTDFQQQFNRPAEPTGSGEDGFLTYRPGDRLHVTTQLNVMFRGGE